MATQHKAITTTMFNGTREKIEYAYYERNSKKKTCRALSTVQKKIANNEKKAKT